MMLRWKLFTGEVTRRRGVEAYESALPSCIVSLSSDAIFDGRPMTRLRPYFCPPRTAHVIDWGPGSLAVVFYLPMPHSFTIGDVNVEL